MKEEGDEPLDENEPEKYKIIGMIGAYVDDFLIAGEEGNNQWDRVITEFHKAFRWTPWECWNFKQTGLDVTQNKDTYEIELSQKAYLEMLEIKLSTQRKYRKSW